MHLASPRLSNAALAASLLVLTSACGTDDPLATSATDSDGDTDATSSTSTSSSTTTGSTTAETSSGGESESSTGVSTSTTDATTGETDTTTTDGCTPGVEGCPCAGDDPPCEGDLVCADGLCVAPVDPACGNGVLENDEECDDGDANDNAAACKADCTVNVCGDGFAGPDEECDDGNAEDTDACLSSCVAASCGDGLIQEGVEACDDGDANADTAACTSACAVAICGDSLIQEGVEECDDGDANADTAACTSACLAAVCGDGLVYEDVEACDDGNDNDNDLCSNDCLPVSNGCPDGQLNAITNYGFESGELAPFTTSNMTTKIVATNPHSGMWTAETDGNVNVEQSFPAVPVSALTEASYWEWHGEDVFTVVQWGYSDNTQQQKVLPSFIDWTKISFLADLDPNKSLVWIRAWGYSGGGNLPDISRFDDFLLCYEP
ncbi:MAG: DUF4215 domain-containing protein [Nannocystaceae bacterium]